MKNVFLYLSAFIPMYILIIVKKTIELIIGNIKLNFLNIFVLCLLIIVIILGLVGLKMEIFNKRQIATKIKLVCYKNITDQHFLGYFSLFVLFAITFDLSRLSMFVVFVGILSMIGVVYVKNKLFYINPFLNILGYNFYDITYTLSNSSQEKNTRIFYKGDLKLDREYMVKIKDENFSFVDNSKTKQKSGKL